MEQRLRALQVQLCLQSKYGQPARLEPYRKAVERLQVGNPANEAKDRLLSQLRAWAQEDEGVT